MSIYQIPALLYYFPSDFQAYPKATNAPNKKNKGLQFETNRTFAGSPKSTSTEMYKMFEAMNEIINTVENAGVVKSRSSLLGKRVIIERKTFMTNQYVSKNGNMNMSPLSATIKIPTAYLLNYLSTYENNKYKIGELLRNRNETIIYKIDAKFRGDPYPGALAAIDYLLCREGKSFEERKYNLVLVWGNLEVDSSKQSIKLTSSKSTINDFIEAVRKSENKNILSKIYSQISNFEIPRYYMQVRYGSSYSKAKHIRVYSYFADAILFPNGALWRDA